ncbi:hypothetical protein [Acetobacter sp.]|jgi:hypothetical protein|uniref:hypothetical protein n=2 Tax=Acetobacter sp. TaxID=440 RepID=UPI0025BE966E|nr:hypothetical protein [Acetobacter sp.]MCH4092444.1 hypothetical protein [Acetobacter sp.]
MITVNRSNRIFNYLVLLSLQTAFGVTAAKAADTTVFVPSTSCSTYLHYAATDTASPTTSEARNRVISAMNIMKPYMTEFASLHMKELMGQITLSFFMRTELECRSHPDQHLSEVIRKVGNSIVDTVNASLGHSGNNTLRKF